MDQSERLRGHQPEIPQNVQEDFREFAEHEISNRNGVAFRSRILPERLACIHDVERVVTRAYYLHTPSYLFTMGGRPIPFTEFDSIRFTRAADPKNWFFINRLGEFRQDVEGKRLMVDELTVGCWVDRENGTSDLSLVFKFTEPKYNPRKLWGRYLNGSLVFLCFGQHLIGSIEISDSGFRTSFCDQDLKKLLEEGRFEVESQKSLFVCHTDRTTISLVRTIEPETKFGKVVEKPKHDVIEIPLRINPYDIVTTLINPALWADPFVATLDADDSWRRTDLVSLVGVKWERK